jgi:hypothetical protein
MKSDLSFSEGTISHETQCSDNVARQNKLMSNFSSSGSSSSMPVLNAFATVARKNVHVALF